jgi:glycosyltransferase involved in cell wall biosynthesis
VPSPRPLFVQSIHTLQPRPAWHWALQNFLSPHAHALVAPSQAVIDKLQSKQPIPNPTVIPNGIPVDRFHSAAPIDNPPWPSGGDTRVVGYIGRFDPVKRLDLLIQAFRLLPSNYHLALVGTPDPQTHLLTRELLALAAGTPSTTPKNVHNRSQTEPNSAPLNPNEARSHPNRIHFLPPTTTPERWYKSFHLFCSLSAAEGYGLTLAEAAAAGLPVVACDTPAIRQTLPEAIWVPPNPTPDEVAQAILGNHAHKPLSLDELKRRYSLETMVDSYAAHCTAWLAEHTWRMAQNLVN